MYGEQYLDVTVFRAEKLEDVDKFGGNDPYVFIFTGLDADDIKKGAATAVKDKGKNPVWNQQLHLEGITERTEYLFVEVMDDETGIDEPIAFTAIPLQQVRDDANKHIQGSFNLFNKDGEHKGQIILGLRLRNPDELNREEEEGPLTEGVSQVVNAHHERFKKLVRKEQAGDAAQAALLTGAGLLALKLLGGGGNKKKVAHEQ
ncbi:Extended synaptotagmin-1 [Actinomortierella wolfii]|nr:Extended synaptotagmin-1 [Actinomortierella wolfii]